MEGIKLVDRRKRRADSKKPPAEELAKLWNACELSSAEIGKKYGVKASTVRAWISQMRAGKY